MFWFSVSFLVYYSNMIVPLKVIQNNISYICNFHPLKNIFIYIYIVHIGTIVYYSNNIILLLYTYILDYNSA